MEIKLLIVEILKLRLGFEKDSVGQQDTTRQMLLFAAPDMPTNSRSKKKIQEVKEAQERIKILIDKLLEIERQLNDETKTWEVRAKTDILFFDWEICFAEIFPQDKPESEKGFDIVIANPPYIDSESMVNQGLEWERKVLQKSYSNLSGNWDIYMAFFETALCMAKFVSFITPDKWLSKPFGEKFRANQMLKRLYRITRAGSKVFENATVDAIITFYKEKSSQIEASHFIDRATLETISKADNNDIKAPYLIDFLFSKNATIIHKIDTTIKTYLLNKAECENACATADFYVVKDLIECNKYPDSKLYYKLINTGTIEKYRNKWPDKEITYGGKFKFPVVNKTKFDSQLGKTYKKRAASSKIIFKGLNLLDDCLDENAELLPGKTTLVICSDNIELLKLLLGLLNSKLPLFYIKTKYASSSYCGGISFSPEMINNLPVPIGLCLSHQIIKLVNQILTDKSTNSQVNTSTLELKIDILVYILYGLTYDEVMIVENPSVKKTNKGEKPKQCGKKKDANQVCKLNVDEKIYSKWLERYQKDSILPSEEELDKAIGKTSVPSAAPETAGPSKVIVEYQEPYQSFGPNYGVYLEYNYDTDDLQYSINSRMNTTKELTPAQIETIKSYLRNRQNIEDFFNNAHSTEPVIRSSHYCVHELSIAYGNRKETVENGELMPWAEPFAKLCK